jgi:histidinol dehydrogenase
MIKTISWQSLTPEQQKQALARPLRKNDTALIASVSNIVHQIKERGDEAVRVFSDRFDKLSLPDYRVPESELSDALFTLDPALRSAMEQAMANVRSFHQAAYPQSITMETMPGISCTLQWRAIDTVGLYVPSGSAPLYSVVYMQAIPAKIAGCSRLILFTPPQSNGKVHTDILAAAHFCGITEIFALGGAQAIAAMAYGTATVPKVDKIFGPGNAYVTLAKQIVASDSDGAAIDQPAGPSEVMVIAEEDSHANWVAADLLAQAEHDSDAQALLVTTSKKLAVDVQDELKKQIVSLPRRKIIKGSLQNGRILLVPDMTTAIDVANRYGPEHLIIHNEDADKFLPQIRHAGSVFLGPWTPESAGDYASGTNNVLPTYGYARAFGGLSVYSFMKSMTAQKITREGIKRLGPTIIKLAEGEGLEAHAVSARLRMENS